VENKDVLLVDDLVDTGGTIVSAIEALKAHGARNIYGAITHPLLSGSALEKIKNSQITKLYVSDTILLRNGDGNDKISVISASGIFAEAIRRTFNNESISSLFDIDKG
jgi:ribose-phosphate pyrophosphokinase